jgi:hypothetical protein
MSILKTAREILGQNFQLAQRENYDDRGSQLDDSHNGHDILVVLS